MCLGTFLDVNLLKPAPKQALFSQMPGVGSHAAQPPSPPEARKAQRAGSHRQQAEGQHQARPAGAPQALQESAGS